MEEDKRQFTRMHFITSVKITLSGGICETVNLIDISLQGVLLDYCNPNLVSGVPAHIEIDFGDNELVLQFKAKFVHQNDGNSGWKFYEYDVDSITHLRRLLELNLGEDFEIENELDNLIAAHVIA